MRYETDAACSEAGAELGLSAEAESAAGLADELHRMLDEAEARLFGAEITKAGGGVATGVNQAMSRPPIAMMVRQTRQRLDHATARLSCLIPRL